MNDLKEKSSNPDPKILYFIGAVITLWFVILGVTEIIRYVEVIKIMGTSQSTPADRETYGTFLSLVFWISFFTVSTIGLLKKI